MAPWASKAQMKYVHMLADKGKISPLKVHEFDSKTKNKHLPEHVKTPKLHKLMKK